MIGKRFFMAAGITACLSFSGMLLAAETGFTTTWSKAGDLAGFENPSGKLSNPGEGGNPGGFLKATRTGGVNVTVKPIPYLRDNWGILFGHGPGTISFDVKALSDHSIPQIHFRLSDGGSSFRYFVTTRKVLKHDQTTADGWVHYTIPWQATWDTERAKAKGWAPNRDTSPWANAMNNPRYTSMVCLGTGGSGGDQIIGLDNFRVEAGKVLNRTSRNMIEDADAPLQSPPREEPVAYYTFEEGAGNALRDHSGNIHHGQINGATWVENGKGWALEFDGEDDYVVFITSRSMNLREALTLEAWIYAEPIYSVWLGVPIMGNGSFGLYQQVHDVVASAAGSARGLLPFRKWVHVAQAWDGGQMRLYVDGTLVSRVKAEGPLGRGRKFLLAPPKTLRATDPPSYDRRFKGKIASVTIYNRALTHEEILENLRTSNITNSVMPMPIPQPGLGRIKVEVDAARLGKPLDNVLVEVQLRKAKDGDGKPLAGAVLTKFDRLGRGVVDLDVPRLEEGEYVIRATAKDAAGQAVGAAGEEPLAWPGSAQFPSGPEDARKLNNLVTELVRVAGPDNSGAAHAFVNPRTGFVFISNRGAQEATITDEDGKVLKLPLSQDYDEAYETMRYLPKGQYTITTPVAKDLIVRAVAQTVHCYAHTVLPVGPRYVYEFGPYAGEFEERYVFPHNNTFYVHDFNADKPFVKEWKAKGRRILEGVPPKARKPQEGQSPLEALTEGLAGGFGFSHPLYDGYLFDEFGAFTESSRIWTQALEQLLSDPRYKGRVLHAWTYAIYDFVAMRGGSYSGEAGREFVRTLQKYDGALQWECYLKSQRTELAAWRHINDKLVGELLATERVQPGIVKSLLVAPYAYVTGGPQWLCMTLPTYDSRTYLEMQVQTVATHPAFEGARGFAVFVSTATDEETMRWTARLFRHYAIEGNTEPLGKDPYLLTHIENPEFEEDGRGWNLKPAEEGAIRFGIFRGFGRLQGRYPSPTHGDTVLITKRSAKGPNIFSQEIKNLEPGRLYSFRMFSADHKNMSRKETHAVTTQFNNATLIPKKCFTHVSYGTRAPRKFMNWHIRVFRANGKTATLRISDWASEKEPGGPIGQELMYNFIKVQPYWKE